MKILIIGQHTYNYGDDAAGVTLVNELLNRSEIDSISIVYRLPGTGRLPVNNNRVNHYNDLIFSSYELKSILLNYYILRKLKLNSYISTRVEKIKSIISESDYIFVSPCGANIGVYGDYNLLAMLILVISQKKKPIFHLNTINKKGSYIFDKIALFCLSYSKIYVREKKSEEYIKSLKLSVQLGVDTAFGLKNPYINDDIILNKPITLIITELNSWHPNYANIDSKEYIVRKILMPLCEFAQSVSRKVQIIPHVTFDNELLLCEELHQIANAEYNDICNFNNSIENVYDYDKAIFNSYFLVTMRYHGVVLAAKNNIPFLAFSYENKMVEVSKYTNCIDYCFNFSDLVDDKIEINTFIQKLEKNYQNIVNKLKEFNSSELAGTYSLPLKELDN